MVRNHNGDKLTPRGIGFSIGERAGSPGCSAKTFGHSGATGTLAWADPVTDTICVVLTTLPGQAANPHPRDLASDRVAKAVISSSAQDESQPFRNPARTRRVLYNFDGDSCLSTKAGGKGPVPVNVDDVKRLIEEVAYDGSRVDTVLVCINAQVMYYPTKVGTMRGTLSTPEERAKWPASEKQRFENLKAFFDSGVDPYAVMLAEAKRRGREALLTFRMNDDHGNDFLRTQFLVDHPDWRLGTEQYRGKGAMDFGRDEVRDYTFRLIEEAVRRYDCDGIELDFNRFPTFFKDGSTDERVAKMNSLVERVRKMLDDVGRERGRRLVLAVRVPSNYGRTPPTPETARQLGCDVPAWVQQGWVDFVAVSEFLLRTRRSADRPVEAGDHDRPGLRRHRMHERRRPEESHRRRISPRRDSAYEVGVRRRLSVQLLHIARRWRSGLRTAVRSVARPGQAMNVEVIKGAVGSERVSIVSINDCCYIGRCLRGS